MKVSAFSTSANDGEFTDWKRGPTATLGIGFAARPPAATLEIDGGAQPPKVKIMNDITRPELDAKLETIEARMETRVARIESKIDLAVETLRQTGSDAKSLRWWLAGLIVTVIVTSIATVIGVYGANASIVQSVIAAFESGRNIGQQQAPVSPQQAPRTR